MWQLSFFCLALVSVACMLGAASPLVRDNMFQKVGMALLCFGCCAKLQQLWEFHWVDPFLLVAHVGMASIAVGSWIKIYWRQPCNAQRFDEWSRATIRKAFGLKPVQSRSDKSN